MIKQLETDRLLLRAPQLEDLESYQKNFNNYEVIRHLAAAVPWPYPETGARDYLVGHIQPRQGRTFGVGVFS